MKKLLLLLIFPVLMWGQNPTNFQYGVKIQNDPKINTATRVMVQDSITGLVGWVLKNNLTVPDATTASKGKIKLAGDLSGTADLPTVPSLVNKADKSTTISTAAPLTGGGDLSINRTISIPVATSSVNGYLSASDWSIFNNKQSSLGFTPENSSNKGALNGYASLDGSGKVPSSQLNVVPDAVTSVFSRTGSVTAQSGDYTTALVTDTSDKRYQTDNQKLYNDATSSIQTQLDGKQLTLVNPVTGTGTTNTLPKFTGSSTIGNSNISDDGLKTTIGGTTSASTGLARTLAVTGTTTATANNDNLSCLYLRPTYTNGAFTGVRNNIVDAAWNTSNFSVSDLIGGSVLFHSVPSPTQANYFIRATGGDLTLNSPLASGIVYIRQANTIKGQFMPTTGNLILQNGGTFTDNGNTLQVTGAIRATTVISTNGFTVATLPSGATVGTGARTYVTDALAPTFNAIVVGGGAVVTPVFYNGTNWIAN